MHRPLFLAAFDRADEHEGLGPVRPGALLGLPSVMDAATAMREGTSSRKLQLNRSMNAF
jgi:hypothetical protein